MHRSVEIAHYSSDHSDPKLLIHRQHGSGRQQKRQRLYLKSLTAEEEGMKQKV